MNNEIEILAPEVVETEKCRHCNDEGWCLSRYPGAKCSDVRLRCDRFNPADPVSPAAPVVASAADDSLPKTLPMIVHGREVAAEPPKALSYQFNRCNKALGSATIEMIRFGAMLETVDDSLTKQRFTNADKGNGQGMSLKSWMETNCPEIPYATAKSYQYAAKGVRNMMQLAADRPLLPLLGVEPLSEAETENLQKKIIETVMGSSLNLLRRASMPQLVGGALKGTHGVASGRRALTAEEKALEAEKMMRDLVGAIGAYLRGNWFEMLVEKSQDDFIAALKHYVQTMNEKMMERR